MSLEQDDFEISRGEDYIESLDWCDDGVTVDISGDSFSSSIKADIDDDDSEIIHSFSFSAAYQDATDLDINGDPKWKVDMSLARAKVADLPDECVSDVFRTFPDTLRVPVKRSKITVSPSVTPVVVP